MKTLREIGHLREIAEHAASSDGVTDFLRDLISEAHAQGGSGPIAKSEIKGISFREVSFAHGGSNVRLEFSGGCTLMGPMMSIEGSTVFKFSDDFTDPIGVRERIFDSSRRLDNEFAQSLTDLLGSAYLIEDTWQSTLMADIFLEPRKSRYG